MEEKRTRENKRAAFKAHISVIPVFIDGISDTFIITYVILRRVIAGIRHVCGISVCKYSKKYLYFASSIESNSFVSMIDLMLLLCFSDNTSMKPQLIGDYLMLNCAKIAFLFFYPENKAKNKANLHAC